MRTGGSDKRKLELTPIGRWCLILINLTASAAWLTGDDSARLAMAMLAAPFVVDLVYKRLRAPSVSLSFATGRTVAGSVFDEKLRIENLSRFTLHGLVVREPRLETPAGGGYVERVARGETATLTISARSRRRGRLTKRSVQIHTDYPFGMLRWRSEIQVHDELVTEPARAEIPAELAHSLDKVQERPVGVGATSGQDYFSLREYRSGEDARHVHAQRSAGFGSLVARVYRGEPDPELVLVIDCRRAPGVSVHSVGGRFERAMSVAATIADEFAVKAKRLRCTAIDRRVRTFQTNEPGGLTELLTYLATARSVPFRPLPEGAIEIDDADLTCWLTAGGYRRAAVPAGEVTLEEALA